MFDIGFLFCHTYLCNFSSIFINRGADTIPYLYLVLKLLHARSAGMPNPKTSKEIDCSLTEPCLSALKTAWLPHIPFVYWFYMCCRAIKTKLKGVAASAYQCPQHQLCCLSKQKANLLLGLKLALQWQCEQQDIYSRCLWPNHCVECEQTCSHAF